MHGEGKSMNIRNWATGKSELPNGSDHLKKLGIEVKEGVAKTGVVGILRGGKPGPCIALRADMDALPIMEKDNLPFASKEKRHTTDRK